MYYLLYFNILKYSHYNHIFFFFNDTATTEIYTLSLHDALPIWLATVPRDKREKSDAYFEGGYWLILLNFLLVAAISIFLLASRISARLRDFAERTCRRCRGSCRFLLQVILYAIPYFLLVATLSFPLIVYQH